MRWLKHMTGTCDDEKVAALIEAGGAESYGLWWMVLEKIGASMEGPSPKCSLSYPLSKWAAQLQQPPQNLRRKLAAIVTAGLLELHWDGAVLTLGCSNLLKYRDEYSKKSGHSPDNVRSKKQIQIQIQTTASAPQRIYAVSESSISPEKEQSVMPKLAAQSEYPLTLSAIRERFPAVDEIFVLRLAQETTQALLSSSKFPQDRIEAATTDKVLARACQESLATGPKDHRAGLFLTTVPRIIITWGTDKKYA